MVCALWRDVSECFWILCSSNPFSPFLRSLPYSPPHPPLYHQKGRERQTWVSVVWACSCLQASGLRRKAHNTDVKSMLMIFDISLIIWIAYIYINMSYVGPSSGTALWAVEGSKNHFRARFWLPKSILKPWCTVKVLRQCVMTTVDGGLASLLTGKQSWVYLITKLVSATITVN